MWEDETDYSERLDIIIERYDIIVYRRHLYNQYLSKYHRVARYFFAAACCYLLLLNFDESL